MRRRVCMCVRRKKQDFTGETGAVEAAHDCVEVVQASIPCAGTAVLGSTSPCAVAASTGERTIEEVLRMPPGRAEKPVSFVAPVLGLFQCVAPDSCILQSISVIFNLPAYSPQKVIDKVYKVFESSVNSKLSSTVISSLNKSTLLMV